MIRKKSPHIACSLYISYFFLFHYPHTSMVDTLIWYQYSYHNANYDYRWLNYIPRSKPIHSKPNVHSIQLWQDTATPL